MPKQRTATLAKGMVSTGGEPEEPAPKDYGVPLNFRVPREFAEAFKVCAARRGMRMNKLILDLCGPELREHGYES
jgi:predicted HicB family RNase H-like nuclease